MLYGQAPGQYDFESPATPETNVTVSGLGAGRWYFVVKASYGAGPKSDPSNEVSVVLYDPPAQNGVVGIDFDDDGLGDSAVIQNNQATNAQAVRKLLSGRNYRLGRLAAVSGTLMFSQQRRQGFLVRLTQKSSALIWRGLGGYRSVRASLRGRFDFALSGCDFDSDGRGDFAAVRLRDKSLTYRSSLLNATSKVPLGLQGKTIQSLYCTTLPGEDHSQLLVLARDRQKVQTVSLFEPSGQLAQEVSLTEKRVSDVLATVAVGSAGPFLVTLQRDLRTARITNLFFRRFSALEEEPLQWHLRRGAEDLSCGLYRKTLTDPAVPGLELLYPKSLTRFDLTPLETGAIPMLLNSKKLNLSLNSGDTLRLIRPVSVVRLQ